MLNSTQASGSTLDVVGVGLNRIGTGQTSSSPIRGSRRQVADIKSEPRPASNRNRWPASDWNAWPASSESALNRDLSGRFGDTAYSREELRAELASYFVGSALDLPCDVPNHVSYIQSWIKVLKSDTREIFRAAADASRIADWILSHHPAHVGGCDVAGDDEQSSAPTEALAA